MSGFRGSGSIVLLKFTVKEISRTNKNNMLDTKGLQGWKRDAAVGLNDEPYLNACRKSLKFRLCYFGDVLHYITTS